jgi:protein O-mannosyl-transferase
VGSRSKRRTYKGSRSPRESGWLVSLKKEKVLLALLIVVATVSVYFPVNHHPFVNYDDMAYVVGNPHIKSGWDWSTISWAFTTFYQFNWHPLTWLSHALDVQIFQLEPGGHHDTNLVLHVVNVLLLYWVLLRATGCVGRSAMVAALFALHPINVESVAWIAERKNLLSMSFFLLGLGAYGWYVRDPRVGRYTFVTLLFVMGLMSKPQVITFPFVLLLWDYWPLRRMAAAQAEVQSTTTTEPLLPARSLFWLGKEKLLLFAICLGSAVVTMIAQQGPVASLEKYPFSIRAGNAIVSYVRYIGKFLWPTHLAILYPHPWNPLPLWQVIPALLLLLAITGVVIVSRGHRYLLVGWLWFLGTLVPMIGLVHVGSQAMADRYAYLPFIGLFIMVSWGVFEWAERQHISIGVVRGMGVVVLLALAIVTHRQLGYWNDNVTLWTHALEVTTDNYIAHGNLAQLLMENGQPEDAIQHYQAALAIYPSDPVSNLQIAVYDHQHGKLQQAIERYDRMISLTPDGPSRAELFSNQGLVYLDLRDNAHALGNFQTAVAMDPRNYRGWLGLGVLAQRSGDLNLAITNYKRANAAKPSEIAYLLLAKALEQSGHQDEAQAAREKAKLLSKTLGASQTLSEGLLAH